MIWIDILFDIFLRGLFPAPYEATIILLDNLVINVCCYPRVETATALS